MAISNSVVRRYLLMSLVAAIVPTVLVGLLYDRYSQALLDELIGERLSVQLTATAKRLESFLDGRRYQVETLASHPAMAALARAPDDVANDEASALLQLEADLPDLYGILFMSDAGRLVHFIAGQAAAGPPYWPERPFSISLLPVTRFEAYDVVGPSAPNDGLSGWFLVRHPLQPSLDTRQPRMDIALHVRLSSLTELMGGPTLAGIVQPVLKTPAGYFNAVGAPVPATERMIAGPEVLPGWQPMLQVEPSLLLSRFENARRVLLVTILATAAVLVFLFYRLARNLRGRVEQLVTGAEAVASGKLDYRIQDSGRDEIAAVSRAFNTMAEGLTNTLATLVGAQRLASLGEFAAGIAHEVRNPLSAIKTTVQALARRESDSRRLQLLNDVENEVTRLTRVVSDLSDFGRPRPPEPAVTPVREVLRRVEGLVTAELKTQGIGLSIQGDSELRLWVDADQLIQILLNLMLNAIQATPEGGLITLRASRHTGTHALLELSDTGRGVPPEALAKLTDPFFTTRPKGMGLGLSISRQLAELNGCTLSIESAVGRGTVVSLLIPLPGEA
jgi:two-component system sensor histidine kinase AtoS